LFTAIAWEPGTDRVSPPSWLVSATR